MNLYDMLRMRPVTAQSAAAAVFRTQGGPSAPPVPVTNVNMLFSRAQQAHGVVDPAIDNGEYVLGQAGVGLGSGFGMLATRGGASLGGFGELLFSKFNFNSTCAAQVMKSRSSYDWLKQHGNDGGAGYFTDIDYEPIDAALLQRAAQGYNYLKSEAEGNGNVAAQVELDTLEAALKSAMQQVDAVADQKNSMLNCDDPRARPWSTQEALYQGLEVVRAQVLKFASAPTRIKAVALTSAPGGSTAVPTAQDNISASLLAKAQQQVQEAQAAAEAAKIQAQMQAQLDAQIQQAQAASAPATGGGLPGWAIPAGVLAAAGAVAFVLLKKRK